MMWWGGTERPLMNVMDATSVPMTRTNDIKFNCGKEEQQWLKHFYAY